MFLPFSKICRTWLFPCAIVSLSVVELTAAPAEPAQAELLVHWNVPGLTEGQAMAAVLPTVTNGTDHMAYAVMGGNLPQGLVLNAGTGTISGTPQEDGNFTVILRATASDGRTATEEVHIQVLHDV